MDDSLEQQIVHAENQIITLDPVLGALVQAQRPIVRRPRRDYFTALCRSIIGQQVSVAAASAIALRLETATGMDPGRVAALSDDNIRAVGLSRQKAGYIRDLAAHFVSNPQVYQHLGDLSDQEVISDLTAVKGVGVWTAQMFLMFTLVRLDVFAPDDIGLQRAMKQLYGWEALPPKDRLEKFAVRWRPYRTVACWHLWESLRNTPVG